MQISQGVYWPRIIVLNLCILLILAALPSRSEAVQRGAAPCETVQHRPRSHPRHVRGNPPVKLSPHIRAEPLRGISMDQLESLRPFLKDSIVLCKQEFSRLPYILAIADERGHGSPGDRVYARGFCPPIEAEYSIIKGVRTYYHPKTCEDLGFEAEVIGRLRLEDYGDCGKGDPAVFMLTMAKEPIEVDFRLYPKQELNFQVKTYEPDVDTTGYILDIKEGLDYVGRNQVVVISLGHREGVSEGHVLDIYETNITVKDERNKPCNFCITGAKTKVKLPDQKIGRLWVYKTCEKLSLALIIEAEAPIKLNDKVGRRN